MSKNLFTTSEPSSTPISLSPSSPIMGWGIVLIVFGIALGSQVLRKNRSQTPLDPYQPLPFTQSLQWLGYGKQLENAKNLEGAIAVYEQSSEQHPNDFQLWHERGLALAKQQRFEAALESYDQELVKQQSSRISSFRHSMKRFKPRLHRDCIKFSVKTTDSTTLGAVFYFQVT